MSVGVQKAPAHTNPYTHPSLTKEDTMTIHPRRTGTALILGLWIMVGSTLPLAEATGDKPMTKEPKPTPTQSCADTCKNTPVKNCAGGTCSDVKPAA